jgi:spore maturation protein CgeB
MPETIVIMKQNLRILYVGPLTPGSTCLQRMQALQGLGHSITSFNTAPNWVMEHKRPPLNYRVINKIIGPPDLTRVNKRVTHLIRQDNFDLLWMDKGLDIKPGTLRKIKELSPQTTIVGYSPDDMGSKHNQSKNFLACLPYYDWYCTTKTYNVKELKDLGCPRVMFTGNAYDPATHRPMDLSAAERERFGGPVGFIGRLESHRAQSIYSLADHGIRVGVWGDGWQGNCPVRHANLIIKGPSIYGDDYARAICSFDICLGFLTKANRDLQTTRSVEVPACGVFMLAERTDEHRGLFEEGKEAEFFETDAELLEKVRFYLAHEIERKRIARAGRERCLKSGYSYHERLKEIFLRINRIQF